jgi:hypothetical protein
VRYLGTYRQVPPIALEASAVALVVLVAYIGAAETGLPAGFSPVAFAVALHMVLLWTWKLVAWFRIPNAAEGWPPWVAVGIMGMLIVLVPAWLWTVSDVSAMRFWVGWTLFFPLLSFTLISDPAFRLRVPSPWARIGRHSALALTLEAAGRGLIATTGLLLITLGDPLLFVAFMTFGSLVFVFMTNWAILLVVLALSRDDDA